MAALEMNRLVSLFNAGRYVELESRAQTLVEQHPNSGFVWKVLGVALKSQGKDALHALQMAAQLSPNDPEAHNNLALALQDCGQLDAAAASYRRALELRPDFAEAHNNLGNALREQKQLDAAVASCLRALEIKPNFAEAYHSLGIALRHQRRTVEAETSCRKALEIKPDFPEAIAFMAELHADKGQFSKAEELFRRLIAIEPESPEAWAGIARMRKMTGDDAAWLAAAQRIAGCGLAPRSEVPLRYAIGKYHDDVNDFEQAFLNYRRANELTKHYGAKYNRRQQTLAVDLLSRTYDRQWVAEQRIDANPSARPVLIVGMPRSGTSLAEQILASHPDVFGAGELPFWKTASVMDTLSALKGKIGERALGKTADDYLRLLDRFSANALRVVDKMPDNFLFLGFIHAAFPNARIIHIQRNPIDTCLSIYFQHFNTSYSYANDLEDLAHYYTEYFRIMEHWRLTLPKNAILQVPYEQLVDDQEGWSRKMLAFIDLPWDARCIDFHQCVRTVGTASNWQVRQKINKSSVLRWHNYAKFVQPLLHLTELDCAADPKQGPGSTRQLLGNIIPIDRRRSKLPLSDPPKARAHKTAKYSHSPR